MRIYEFSGTHLEAGLQHGRMLSAEIRESAELRVQGCIRASQQAGQELSRDGILRLASLHLRFVEDYTPGLFQEVKGIAEGAGMSPEEIFIVSGYTDFVDVVRRSAGSAVAWGCSAFFADPSATRGQDTLMGQTWDMFAEAEKTVIGMRIRIDDEPELVTLAYPGCVGMMGMNSMGVGVTGNNLRPTDAQPGVPWTFLCRKVLTTGNAEEAARALTEAPLCSGHNFIVGDAQGVGVDIETTGAKYGRFDISEPTFVHTNHYTHPSLLSLAEPLDPMGCTVERECRLDSLLRSERGNVDVSSVQRAFRDHEGKPRSVCSHDYPVASGDRIRTCGALIMNLTQRKAHMVKGLPCQGEFEEVSLAS